MYAFACRYKLSPEGAGVVQQIINHSYDEKTGDQQENQSRYANIGDALTYDNDIYDMPEDYDTGVAVSTTSAVEPVSSAKYNFNPTKLSNTDPKVHEISDSEDDEIDVEMPLAARLAGGLRPPDISTEPLRTGLTCLASSSRERPKVSSPSPINDDYKLPADPVSNDV